MTASTNNTFRGALALALAGLAVVATTASGSDEPATKVDAPTGAVTSASFAIGDYVSVGDWTIIAHGITDPVTSASGFMAPSPGNRWVGVDVETTNNSATAQAMSSMICFDLIDSTNRSYNITITDSGSTQMDGSVDPGASMRGDVEFEIPADATGLKLKFSCDLLSSNSATINLS